MNETFQTSSDELTPTGFIKTVQITLERYGFLGGVSLYLALQNELRKFVSEAPSSEEKRFRKQLIRKFNLIQKSVPCAHSPYQFVLMAKYILNLDVEGPIVQCGCFKGGSTAKLSILAQHTGRRLYVCDSFAGLPTPKAESELSLKGHDSRMSVRFEQGEYSGLIDVVRENVGRYGALDVCEFIPGFFEKTLPGLEVSPAFVFIDVDLASSGRDCLRSLWPRLRKGGYFFTHEATFPEYIYGILDREWWKENLQECPSLIFGAGSGLSPLAQSIAYFKKTN